MQDGDCMSWREELRQRAKKALSKQARYGPDIDVREFSPVEVSLQDAAVKSARATVAIEAARSAGVYLQLESSVLEAEARFPGVEIMPIEEALERYPDVMRELFWNAVPVDEDKYTAIAELRGRGGVFLRVKSRARIVVPVHLCFFMRSSGSLQAPHNVIVAESGSDVYVVSGCTMMTEAPALHAGVTEIYVEEDARVCYVMIHRWSRGNHVRPRTGVIVERGGELIYYYVGQIAADSLQTMPRAILESDARAHLASIMLVRERAHVDSGWSVKLSGSGSSCEVITRCIARDETTAVLRAEVIGERSGARGHIDCKALLLSDAARVSSIPALDARDPGVVLTHEAALGKLREEEVLWLIARGFSREEAESILVRGFLRVRMPKLPPHIEGFISAVVSSLARASV